MTAKELEKLVYEIKSLEAMKGELEDEINEMIDRVKAEMVLEMTDSLAAGAFKVTWKLVTSSRVDTTALKKELPEVAARYMKESSVRRFVIS